MHVSTTFCKYLVAIGKLTCDSGIVVRKHEESFVHVFGPGGENLGRRRLGARLVQQERRQQRQQRQLGQLGRLCEGRQRGQQARDLGGQLGGQLGRHLRRHLGRHLGGRLAREQDGRNQGVLRGLLGRRRRQDVVHQVRRGRGRRRRGHGGQGDQRRHPYGVQVALLLCLLDAREDFAGLLDATAKDKHPIVACTAASTGRQNNHAQRSNTF